MRTQDVKCNQSYILDGKETVVVLERVKGRETKKANMHSGVMFTGYKREQKKFRLSNGLTVKAQRLEPIQEFNRKILNNPWYENPDKLEGGQDDLEKY